MREDPIPQVAEHAFGYSVKPQVVVANPQYAVLLGLRHLGWLTFKQCEVRIFSWSYENITNNSPVHKDLTRQTLLDMEEIGLVTLKTFGVIFHPDGTEEPWIIKSVHEATTRFTKRYHQCENEGRDDDEEE